MKGVDVELTDGMSAAIKIHEWEVYFFKPIGLLGNKSRRAWACSYKKRA